MHGVLGKHRHLCCDQPLSVKFLEDKRSKGRLVSNQLLSVCNIMFLCQHLGMGRNLKSDPAYKPPPTLSTSTKHAKWGAYMRDTTVVPSMMKYVSTDSWQAMGDATQNKRKLLILNGLQHGSIIMGFHSVA